MDRNRAIAARLIAGVIALCGTPLALLLGAWPFEIGFPRGLLVYLFFAPGWFAYFALIWAAAGKRLPGDPLTTWIPGILVNGFWLVLLGFDTDFDTSSKAFTYYLVRVYVLAAVVGGIVGLIIELRRTHREP